MRSIWFKNVSVAGLVVLGAIGASAAPASAHYTTTRCDNDGDDCYTVVCDDDGDDCRRVSSYSRDHYDRYRYRWGNPYGYSGSTGFGVFFGNGWSNGYGRYNDNGYGHRWYLRDDDDDDDDQDE